MSFEGSDFDGSDFEGSDFEGDVFEGDVFEYETLQHEDPGVLLESHPDLRRKNMTPNLLTLIDLSIELKRYNETIAPETRRTILTYYEDMSNLSVMNMEVFALAIAISLINGTMTFNDKFSRLNNQGKVLTKEDTTEKKIVTLRYLRKMDQYKQQQK